VATEAPRPDRYASAAKRARQSMQLFGILVPAPSAAPSEGHAALSFGVTPPSAAVDACPELADDGALTPVPPTTPGTEVAVVVLLAVTGTDGTAATPAPPDDVPEIKPVVAFVEPTGVAPTAFPGSRLDTLGNVVVAVPGKPAAPYAGEEF
jgi:hypothetical protein